MLGRVTLDQLQILIAVADYGSFSAAARRVHRVQSAVSQSIQSLEDALQLQLFDRSQKLPRLTDAGQAILSDARRVVGNTDALRARVRTVEDVFDPRHGRFLYKRAIEAMEPGDRRGVQLDQASLHRLLAEMAS